MSTYYCTLSENKVMFVVLKLNGISSTWINRFLLWIIQLIRCNRIPIGCL